MDNLSKNNSSVQKNSAKASSSAAVSTTSKSSPASGSIMQSMLPTKKGVSVGKVFMVLLLMILLGVGFGYGGSLFSAKTGASIMPSVLNPNAPVKGKIYGNGDPSIFKDAADGILKNGGIDGEGQYHLVRPGGDSQNVYLTSSTVDLSQFINQKIKVWGQTQAAQHAGWLMDVGKVQVE